MRSQKRWNEFKCKKNPLRCFISIGKNILCATAHETLRCFIWPNKKKTLFLNICFCTKNTKKKIEPTNQKNIIFCFIILAFNRTNSLIALLCTETCAACRTWLDLVSLEKFYTNFFFPYSKWIETGKNKISFLLFSQFLLLLFQLNFICELVFGGLLSIEHFDFMLFTVNSKNCKQVLPRE